MKFRQLYFLINTFLTKIFVSGGSLLNTIGHKIAKIFEGIENHNCKKLMNNYDLLSIHFFYHEIRIFSNVVIEISHK